MFANYFLKNVGKLINWERKGNFNRNAYLFCC